MPSISKQLLESIENYYNDCPYHPGNKIKNISTKKKFLIYQRMYYHLANGVPGFSHLYKRAAQLAPTQEAKDYLMNIYDKLQQAHPSLIADYKHYTINPTCDPTAICFPFQSYEAEMILVKNDLALFLGSQIGLAKCVTFMMSQIADDLQVALPWLLSFGDTMNIDLMAEWIDRLAPKDWTQEYFDEMRNACIKQVVLDFPGKYDYFLTGINSLPLSGYLNCNFNDNQSK